MDIDIKSIADQLYSIVQTSKEYYWLTLGIVAVLIVIHIINQISGKKLNHLGILPRHPLGLPGIVCSPFLHQDISHLIFNLVPLFLLLNLLIQYGLSAFITMSVVLILSSGFLVWLFGRRAIHIGASGFIMALWAFLLVVSFQHISAITIFIIFICVYYLGGLVFSVIPKDKTTSWEGHLFGLIAGVAWALILIIPSQLSQNIKFLILKH